MEITAEKIAEAMVLAMESVKSKHDLPESTRMELISTKHALKDDILEDGWINEVSTAFQQMLKSAPARR